MPESPAQTPLMTVVIPTFNRKESLRRTLGALERQESASFEVLVVSDGSTDGTDDLVEELSRTSPFPLRLIAQPNAGPARARNRGVQEAQGEIIVFLDDDVEPLPRFLTVHALHHAQDDCLAVIGPMLPDPLLKWREPVWIAWEHASLQKEYTRLVTGFWPSASPNHFYTGNASVRRCHLLAAGGFDEEFKRQEDVELAFRMMRQCGMRFKFDPEAAGTHRPSRTFASWLHVPYAYGALDVVRARRGDVAWARVRHGYCRRNLITRALAGVVLTCPPTSAPLRLLLLGAARAAYGLRQGAAAAAALSVVYNLRYLEGVRQELGAGRRTLGVLRATTEPR
ncbi:MAG: glycosyl transferase family 2 [Armatimonadetes bacterium]|jgi:GT2 family glycosyltransferase|nr:glycosyl transferase family 2 [Armatimonadota bacterium]